MRYSSLSSSSTYGNAYLVEGSPGRLVMVDCGLSLRRLEMAMDSLGVSAEQLDALLITHHHQDHTQALRLKGPLASRYGIPVYGSGSFWEGWKETARRAGWGSLDGVATVIESGQTAQVGGLSVTAFSRPHDASGSLGFVLESRSSALAVLTDLGHVPSQLCRALRGVEHIIMEANHDRDMEENSGRPRYLKDRVLGPLGHLSNDQAGEALEAIMSRETRSVLLAHLSLDCNTPPVALATVSRYLGRYRALLETAPAREPSGWLGH